MTESQLKKKVVMMPNINRVIKHCIVCKKELVNICPDANQPSGGTEFLTYGHYGSRITDTMGQSIHYINVCDDCLETAKKGGNCIEVMRWGAPKEW